MLDVNHLTTGPLTPDELVDALYLYKKPRGYRDRVLSFEPDVVREMMVMWESMGFFGRLLWHIVYLPKVGIPWMLKPFTYWFCWSLDRHVPFPLRVVINVALYYTITGAYHWIQRM